MKARNKFCQSRSHNTFIQSRGVNITLRSFPHLLLLLFIFCFLFSCTFNYGDSGSSGNEVPDLVMENVEYIRVQAGDPIARFVAERAERYESQGIMKITNFSFEQYGKSSGETNAFGSAGFASVDIETGDIFMDDGVLIDIPAEDIIISTHKLEWIDEDRFLFTGEEDEVNILQHNGTNFTGIGLNANARTRTWEFSGNVSGVFIHEDKEEEAETEEGEEETW